MSAVLVFVSGHLTADDDDDDAKCRNIKIEPCISLFVFYWVYCHPGCHTIPLRILSPSSVNPLSAAFQTTLVCMGRLAIEVRVSTL